MSVQTPPHPQHQEQRQEVVGLAPKACSEIKYQERAGQCSLSFLIQTGGRSEETRDLWGEVKRNTVMLRLRTGVIVLQEQSVESLCGAGSSPARVCAPFPSRVFARRHTNALVLLVPVHINCSGDH